MSLTNFGAAATYSANVSDYAPSKAQDGILAPFIADYVPTAVYGWQALIGSSPVFKADLGSIKAIEQIDIVSCQNDPTNATPATPNSTTGSGLLLTGYLVEYSTDDITYYTLDTITSNTFVHKRLTFSPTNLRYLRITPTASGDGYARIVELQIWGEYTDTTAPSDVVLGSTTALSATSARFAFTPATDDGTIAGNNFEYDTVDTFNSGNLIQEFVASNTSPRDKTGLLAGRRWYARAKAKDSATPTPNLSTNWSNTVHVDLPPTINTASPLNNAIINEPFSQTLSKTGDDGTFEIRSGAPSGFVIDDETGEVSWNPDTLGTTTNIVIRYTVTASGLYAEVTYSITVIEVLPLNYGFDPREVQLFCEADNLELSDGNNVTSFTDQSINARHLTASSSYPTFQTNEINSLPVVRFSSSNPLKHTDEFVIKTGWILAKYDGSTFPDTSDGYKGLLSDLVDKAILSGERNSNEFKDQGFDYFEFRSNDRIYSPDVNDELHAPAPMSSFKLIFFRFWRSLTVDGIQLGQELNNGNRKWSGDVALLILTNKDYCESDIQTRTKAMAEAYGLTLANVFPYQADKTTPVSDIRSLNFYDPPEGDRIVEVLADTKQSLNLQFNIRRQDEFKKARNLHRLNYPEVPLVYRNYQLIPPEDIEGYISSELEWTGANNNFNYSFQFREK